MTDQIQKLIAATAGWKTYTAAAILAIQAALAFRAGDIPGAITLIGQALGLFGLRSAISALPAK